MTNWQTRRLAELAAPGRSIISGPFGSSIGKRFFTDEGVPVIRGNNLTKGVAKFKDGGFVYLTPEKADELNAYAVKHDIIYTAAGTIGQVGIIPENSKYKKYTISNKQIRVRLDFSQIIPLYAYLALSSDHMISLVERQNTGSTIPLINLEIIRNLKIQLPPVKEQERIVIVLQAWNEYIEKLERKIELKEQLRKGLMQQLLTGKRRLPGFNGEWKDYKISDFANESRVKDMERDPRKRLTVRLHLMGVEARSVRGTESIDTTQYFSRSQGQLVFGKQNIFRGAIGIIPQHLDGYASSQDIPAFEINSDIADTRFVFCLLSRKNFYEWLENFATGSGSKRLQTHEFYRIRLSLPDILEQDAIANVLEDSYREIKHLQIIKQQVERQKKYLLKNLITGTIRTPENLKPYEAQP